MNAYVPDDKKGDGIDDESNRNILPTELGVKAQSSETWEASESAEEAALAHFTQVPTDDQILELLSGKSEKEKRNLLKEIEKARQQAIHMKYLLKQ